MFPNESTTSTAGLYAAGLLATLFPCSEASSMLTQVDSRRNLVSANLRLSALGDASDAYTNGTVRLFRHSALTLDCDALLWRYHTVCRHIRSAFSTASLTAFTEHDAEFGNARDVIEVTTGFDDVDKMIAVEDKFYASIISDVQASRLLRDVTVTFR